MIPIQSDDVLFAECIEALGARASILSKQESNIIWNLFKKTIPIIKGGSRIDWNKVGKKASINQLSEIIVILEKLLEQAADPSIYLLWNDISLPVVKTTLEAVLLSFDDVTAVGFETWCFNPYQGYVVEFYYLGEMTAGVVPVYKA